MSADNPGSGDPDTTPEPDRPERTPRPEQLPAPASSDSGSNRSRAEYAANLRAAGWDTTPQLRPGSDDHGQAWPQETTPQAGRPPGQADQPGTASSDPPQPGRPSAGHDPAPAGRLPEASSDTPQPARPEPRAPAGAPSPGESADQPDREAPQDALAHNGDAPRAASPPASSSERPDTAPSEASAGEPETPNPAPPSGHLSREPYAASLRESDPWHAPIPDGHRDNAEGDAAAGRGLSDVPADSTTSPGPDDGLATRPEPGRQDAIGAVEETLHGAGGSPRRMLEGLPEQPRSDYGLAGFNPLVVSPRYSEAAVRDGVMRVSLGAVADLAAQAADPHSTAGTMLDQRVEAFQDQLRAWTSGGTADPRLSELLDSFVRRPDKRSAAQLAAVISSAGIDPGRAAEVWDAFGRCGTLAEKEAFADRFAQQMKGGRDDG